MIIEFRVIDPFVKVCKEIAKSFDSLSLRHARIHVDDRQNDRRDSHCKSCGSHKNLVLKSSWER